MSAGKLLLSIVAGCVVSMPVLGQGTQPTKKDEKKPTVITPGKKEATGQPSEAMPPEMEAWVKAGTPGPQHEVLKDMAGNWDATCKFWMAGPDQPPTESKAKMQQELIFGGRFIQQRFQGDFMGQPFEGIGYFGYDNIRQKYVSTWTDSMSTSFMVGYGDYDQATKTFKSVIECPDPMGGIMKAEHVSKIVDKDHHTFEMYRILPDGTKFKEGEMHYTRVGAKPASTPKPAGAK